MADGIYTNHELIDTIIHDLNNVVKQAVSGQYLQSCVVITQITQKLINLRNTVDDTVKNRDQTIETLKEELRNAGHTVNDMTPQEFIDNFMKKDGAE